ncbi:P-type ATPase [Bifidobacterium choloepi]|uniref:ATPase P n=1 Tax=Bifidobacterium choloepi TaxID=2614131 RepID=A0A6I5N296_9BIFI|nr:ATPase P [Bifidobacterium choloepi]NEG70295.1 ATPase P [Bifidobacterium choloepi]
MGLNLFLSVVCMVAAILLTILVIRFFFAAEPDGTAIWRPNPVEVYPERESFRLLVTREVVAAALTIVMIVPIVVNFLTGQILPDWMVNPWLQAILITPVMFFSGYPIHLDGWAALRRRTPNMDSLASIGTIAAYAYSLIIAAVGQAFPDNMRDTYLEFVGVIVTLVLLARIVEQSWVPAHRSFPLQRKVDRFTNVFVPVVLIIGIWTFFLWLVIVPDGTAFPKALSAAIAVLIIACPCPLGWASPLSVSFALRAAHRDGMHIQSMSALQRATNIRSVIFSTAVVGRSKEAMAELNKAGIRTTVLDVHSPTAMATAGASMAQLAGTKNRQALVAFVSDGTEAPEIRRAVDVSIVVTDDGSLVVGNGTASADELAQRFPDADVVAIDGGHSRVLDLMKLSRTMMLNIRENLVWTFVFNIIGIPLAAGVFYPLWGWLLAPVWAAVAMILSSLAVLLNSQRLRLLKFDRRQ